MKKILMLIVFAAAVAYPQGTQLKTYDYLMQAGTAVKTKAGKIGFLTAQPAAGAKEESNFGFWLTSNTNASAVVLEVKEGEKAVYSVTAKDFAAKAKVQSAGTKTSWSLTGSGVSVTIDADVVADESMPLGKAIAVSVKVKGAAGKNLSAVLSLFGDGFVGKVGNNAATTSRVEKGKPEYPFVIAAAEGNTAVSVDGDGKTAGRTVKFASAPVAMTGEDVPVLSVRAVLSTVKNAAKSVNQAKNIEARVAAKKEVTEMSVLVAANRNNPLPGDTILYTITYHNVGTAPAQDVVVSNPVPASTSYVDNSAAGEKAEVTLDRKKVPLPQQGEVTGVNWKIGRRLNPGDEGTVTFKAVIR